MKASGVAGVILHEFHLSLQFVRVSPIVIPLAESGVFALNAGQNYCAGFACKMVHVFFKKHGLYYLRVSPGIFCHYFCCAVGRGIIHYKSMYGKGCALIHNSVKALRDILGMLISHYDYRYHGLLHKNVSFFVGQVFRFGCP